MGSQLRRDNVDRLDSKAHCTSERRMQTGKRRKLIPSLRPVCECFRQRTEDSACPDVFLWVNGRGHTTQKAREACHVGGAIGRVSWSMESAQGTRLPRDHQSAISRA